MAPVHDRRTCGNCGAAVDVAAVTCPACDALLAAYEAPSGSAAGSAPSAFDIVPAQTGAAPPSATGPKTPTTPSRSFSADESLADARRTLGMPSTLEPTVTPERVPEPATSPIAAPEPEPVKLKAVPTPAAESIAVQQDVFRAKEPRTRGLPADVRVSLEERQAAAKSQKLAEEQSGSGDPPESDIPMPHGPRAGDPTIAMGRILIIGGVILVFIAIMSRSPFGFSPFFVFVFAVIALGTVIRSSAKAGGRKSTWMDTLDDRDRWNRR